MAPNCYPRSPKLDNYEFIKPSAEFRSSVSSVILAIIAFLLLYLILIVIASTVLYFTVKGGIAIIVAKPHFITLAMGGGLILLGIMLFVFLFKFIFSKKEDENPFRVEINENQHPQLFAFIHQLNEDTQTKPPKRIFISPDVNAMVFYNSSFWSLFFPVRKNLEIGLGLVNSLTVSEFKAVLAHEFGHFSQRSMKIGSYIYTVNRVIYNLVYEYDSWDNALSGWAQAGGIFGLFAGITFWLVERIRDLLKIAYNFVNISYMKLSREMEYHADLIAVSVSGNKPMTDALRKIEFSSFCYEYTTGYLNTIAGKKKASSDIYQNHSFTTSFLARHNNIAVDNGNFKITDEDIENHVIKSRINIKDQWASHPSLTEREANLSKVNIEAQLNEESAWTVFNDPGIIRKELTQRLYKVGFPEENFTELTEREFQGFVSKEIDKYKIAENYNGFYDDRYLTQLDTLSLVTQETKLSFDELYTKENVEKIKRLNANKIDLEILEQIRLKQIQTKYFEYDDKKYKIKNAAKLIEKLKAEISDEEKFVAQLDKDSFIFNYKHSAKSNNGSELRKLYDIHFEAIKKLEEIEGHNTKFQNFANQIYTKQRWTEDEVTKLATELSRLEKELKDFIKTLDQESLLEKIEPNQRQLEIRDYLSSNDYYSKLVSLEEEAFMNISNLLQDVIVSLGTSYGEALKKMTDFQLEIYKRHVGLNGV